MQRRPELRQRGRVPQRGRVQVAVQQGGACHAAIGPSWSNNAGGTDLWDEKKCISRASKKKQRAWFFVYLIALVCRLPLTAFLTVMILVSIAFACLLRPVGDTCGEV